MTGRLFAIGAMIVAIVAAPGAVRAQESASMSGASTLPPEWNVERKRPGRAHVVGYLYNTSGTMDAANVLLRVEQLTPDDQVGQTRLSPVFGDVRARGRLAFEAPIASTTSAVRVTVESVDWVQDCR